MALIDNKITDGDISTYGVVSAPDRLTGTANENKQVFDNLIKQAVKVKMNELMNDLIAETAAGELGAKAPSGLSGSNIQTVLQSLKTYVDNTKVAKVPGKGLSENDYTDADKALVGQIPGKAGVDNVLTKDNVTPFEPTGEYNPCTKKYADNLAFQSGNVTSVFGRGGAVVAQNGDYTPQQVGAEPAFSVLPVSKGGTGNTSGAAAKLTTKRTIALSGAVTGTATGFDGSANITIPVTYVNAAPKENFIQNGHFYAGGLYNPSGKTEFRSPETQGPYGWNVELPTGSEGIYIVNKGIALKPGTATSVGIVQPYNDYTKSLIGEVCTVSLVDGDGNLNEAQVNIGDEGGGKTIGKFRLFSTSLNFLYIRLYKENSQNETITSVKAEFGSQTLAKEVSGGKWQLIDTPNKYATLWGGLTPFVCTEAQYAALVDKNPNTLYFIVG